MMKNYVKPELFYESYELSQNIAACGWDMTHDSPEKCKAAGDPAFGNPDILVFTTEAVCEGNIFEGYCYENSADNIAIKIFRS